MTVDSGYVYYTPVYYILAQLSRTFRPGDVAVKTQMDVDNDQLYACATMNAGGVLSVQLLNTAKEAASFSIQIGPRHATVEIEANSLQTIRIPVPG